MKRKISPVKPNICIGFSSNVFLNKRPNRFALKVLFIMLGLILKNCFCNGWLPRYRIEKMFQVHLTVFSIGISCNNRKTF